MSCCDQLIPEVKNLTSLTSKIHRLNKKIMGSKCCSLQHPNHFFKHQILKLTETYRQLSKLFLFENQMPS